MQRSNKWLSVALTLALGACGGGTRAGTDAGTADTGGGSGDAASVDTGTGTDTGPTAADSGGSDGGGRDAAMTGDGGTADLVASTRADQEAVCACDLASSYTTTAACASSFVGVPAFDACVRAGYAADAAMYGPYAACLAPVLDAHRACISAASGCMDPARTDCDNALGDASFACMDPATMAFTDARDACAMTTIVGTGADTCDDAAAASTMVGDAVFSGTTLLAGDHRTPSCGDTVSGPDVAHRWAAPADGMYRFETFGSEFDTVLELLDVCAATATSVGCNDDGFMDGRLSDLTLMMTAGQTVQIIVDGYGIDGGGNYVVNIHAL